MNNVFLTRSLVGWLERENASSISTSGRREAFLSLGSAGSVEETYRIADANLSEFATRRVQTDVAIRPSGAGDVPFGDYDVADTIDIDGTPHRVLNLSFSEVRGTGRVTYTPVLNQSVILDDQERMFNALRKMVRGTGLGRYISAQPYSPPFADRLAIFPAEEAGFCETFPTDGDLYDPQDLVWRDADNPNWGVGTQVIISGGAATGAGSYCGGEAQSEVTDAYHCWAEFDYVNPGTTFDDIWLTLGGDDHFGWDGGGVNYSGGITLFIFYSGGYYAEIADYDNPAEFVFVSTSDEAQGRWRLEVDGDEARVYKDTVLIMTADISTAAPLDGKKLAFELESDIVIDNVCYGDL